MGIFISACPYNQYQRDMPGDAGRARSSAGVTLVFLMWHCREPPARFSMGAVRRAAASGVTATRWEPAGSQSSSQTAAGAPSVWPRFPVPPLHPGWREEHTKPFLAAASWPWPSSPAQGSYCPQPPPAFFWRSERTGTLSSPLSAPAFLSQFPLCKYFCPDLPPTPPPLRSGLQHLSFYFSPLSVAPIPPPFSTHTHACAHADARARTHRKIYMCQTFSKGKTKALS